MSEGEQPDESQKTEEPTAKRLEESRKKGQVALSRELNNWLMLLAGTVLIATMSGPMMNDLLDILSAYIEYAHNFPQGPGGIGTILGDSYISTLKVLFLPLLFLMTIAFLGPFLQVGPIFAPEAIKPDLSKISPIKGFSRLFSMRAIIEFTKGVLKISLIALIGVIILYPYFDKFEYLIGLEMPLVLNEIRTILIKMMTGILVALLVVAVIDVVYQRMEHYKKMRMTKQEVKDEFKQSEGDPHVKAKLRQLRSEKSRQRMMQAVPKADVVITNPTHFSIALKYDPETMEAPQCVAKGINEVALRIRELAREHDIVIYENPPLARVLYDTVDLDETIPAEHYKAVAEIISFVFKRRSVGV